MPTKPSPTLAERRTIAANRLLVGTPLLRWISAVKWAIYPWLVKFAPRVAIWVHEPESSAAFWNAIGPGMIVVDGGANMGGFSILASRRVGSNGRVFAFEPEPRNFARLTARLRRYANVLPLQQAISDRSGEAVLYLDSDFHAGHTLVDHAETPKSTLRVPMISLDEFVQQHTLPGVDVVKFDIEGVELRALDGMKNILAGKRRPTILCEVHPPILPEEIAGKLTPYGYRCSMLDAQMTGTVHEVPVHLLAVPPERAG